MNNLLVKLHKNKVLMTIEPFNEFSPNSIRIRFHIGPFHKYFEMDLKHLQACGANAEDIIILELEAFLKEHRLEVKE